MFHQNLLQHKVTKFVGGGEAVLGLEREIKQPLLLFYQKEQQKKKAIKIHLGEEERQRAHPASVVQGDLSPVAGRARPASPGSPAKCRLGNKHLT